MFINLITPHFKLKFQIIWNLGRWNLLLLCSLYKIIPKTEEAAYFGVLVKLKDKILVNVHAVKVKIYSGIEVGIIL